VVHFSLNEPSKVETEPADDPSLDGGYEFGYNRLIKKRVPSGRLELHIDSAGVYWANCRGVWRDGKKPLEKMLGNFVAGLEQMAAQTKAQAEAERQKAELQRAATLRRQGEERQRAEKKARYDAELARLQTLRQQVKCWREAEDMRLFIGLAEQSHLSAKG